MAYRLSLTDAPGTLAVFPLPGALLLPRARLPLNIFEPRYLALIEDAMKTDHRMIGIIQPRRRQRRDEGPSPLYNVGCAGRITTFSETDDGRFLIALTGVCRFRVREEVEGFAPYRRVAPDFAAFEGDLQAAPPSAAYDAAAFLESVDRYFKAKSLETDWDSLRRADEETLVNALSMLCPFSPEEKQALIEAATVAERREALSAMMTFGALAPQDPDEGGNLQ